MKTVHYITHSFLRFCAVVVFLSSCTAVLADSAQIEMTDPVLPIPHGRPANGTAFYGWVGGGHSFNSAGNLGGTFPLGTIHHGQIYFNGDIFTWVDNPKASDFRPRRIVYTLEPGYNYVKGDNEYRFFIKHQSYHDVDILAGPHEGYELYGLSYRRLRSPKIELRVGEYLDRRSVDYDFDISGAITVDLPSGFGYRPYLRGWVHHVTESGNNFGRDHFTDYAAEYGFTINDGLKVIARYEFLNDIESFGSRSDHHFLIGPMYMW